MRTFLYGHVLLPLASWHLRITLRTAAVWLGFRFAAAWMQIVRFGVLLTCLMVVVVSLAVWHDAKRRGELLFLANLGRTPLPVVVNAGLAALALELVLQAWLAVRGVT